MHNHALRSNAAAAAADNHELMDDAALAAHNDDVMVDVAAHAADNADVTVVTISDDLIDLVVLMAKG